MRVAKFVVGLAIAGVLCAGPVTAGSVSTYDELILTESGGLRSTADGAFAELIRRLAGNSREPAELPSVTVDYPADESIFPSDMHPPTFLWHDAATEADRWLVEVALPGDTPPVYVLVPGMPPPEGRIDPLAISGTNEIYKPTPYQASARAWKPSRELWAFVTGNTVERPATVKFFGYRNDDPSRVVSRGRMTLKTSSDPVGAPVFYRDVPLSPAPTGETIMPLPKGALPLIAWRLRDLERPASRRLLTDMPSCANCHSFSADGKTLGMDIDGPQGDKGAYALAPIEPQMVIEDEEVITWNSFPDKLPGHKTLGFLSRVSPDGEHVVSTVNEMIYVANFQNYGFGQVFYPTRGILAYYTRSTGEFDALPGADDPEYVHTDGVWTPDGKSIVFARGEAKDPYVPGKPLATYAGDPNETPMRYDLYRIPFNNGQGGKPVPIAGASGNGMSNNFPKVSPDGKWVVFVKCKNGQLMRPDSRLWIVPIEGGEAREMRSNLPVMNSWHSFSPNGKWMVFSSKSNTPYTQMFLTHIDGKGRSSPALLVENSTAANRAVNIPEFVNIDYDDLQKIDVPTVAHYRHFHKATDLAVAGKDEEAVVEFMKALEKKGDDSRIHNGLSRVLLRLGRHDLAMTHIRTSLEINPYNPEMQANMGYLLAGQGDLEGALKHLNAAVALYPRQPVNWYNRASLQLKMGNQAKALSDYNEAIRLSPRYSDAYNGRGVLLKMLGDLPAARADFDNAIKIRPVSPTPWYFRGLIRMETGDPSGALDDLNKALELVGPDSPRRPEIDRQIRLARTVLDGDG